MTTYVEIAVNVPGVAGVFHYHLPAELENQAPIGCLVRVPFGAQTVQGVILRTVETPEVTETRAVLDLVDPLPVLTPAQIELSKALAAETLSPLPACIELMLPAGLTQQADTLFTLLHPPPETGSFTPVQAHFIQVLQRRGPLRGRQIDQALPRQDWRAAARGLVRQGLVAVHQVLPPPTVRPKFVHTAQLIVSPEEALQSLPGLARGSSAALARRQAILQFLCREPGPVEVAWVYAESGGNLADLQALAERGLVGLGESEAWRDPVEKLVYTPAEAPPLTHDQADVWAQLVPRLCSPSACDPTPILLHGVTGSGKTEIYLRAVEATLVQGRQAIVLVPEIALTPQTLRRFVARFPGQVGITHSRLSAGERYDTWRRARAGRLGLVVGPRSALFMPLPRPGLIILDEFHDAAYYQEDLPRYHALQAARLYARLSGAVVLLGSATPEVGSLYQAVQHNWLVLRLPRRILAHRETVRLQAERLNLSIPRHPQEGDAETLGLPPVQIVDMRQELHAGNRSIFSRSLRAAIEHTLERGQQAILFLNRRGTATYVFCRDCGHSLCCPRCDLPLTVWARPAPGSPLPSSSATAGPGAGIRPMLLCHHCGYQRGLPEKCPQCNSRNIRQFGTGTEKVEAEVQALFPQARTLRWDWETTRTKDAHEIILAHFSAHRADILVGTQMLAKGLDLPLVTLVGVILADVGLNLPDFRAGERTFQVLTQVAGRAGRSPLGGEVILQTFQPEHYAIQAAAGHNFQQFYEQELAYRRKIGYPPFTRLVRLEYRHADAQRAEHTARTMAAGLQARLEAQDRRATFLIGPTPCFFARLDGAYRWQIVLRGPEPAEILRGLSLGDWRIEVDPISLL